MANSWTFITGVMLGLFIRYTDILPIMGGFVMGLTVQKLPEIMNMDFMPTLLQGGYYQLVESINQRLVGRTKTKKTKLNLKKDK